MFACPKCGGTSFWQLDMVREQQGDGVPVPLAPLLRERTRTRRQLRMNERDGFQYVDVPEPYCIANGRFEALICRGCAHVRWYARGLQPDDRLEPVERACPECRDVGFWRVSTVQERSADSHAVPMQVLHHGRNRWRGQFSALISRGCGLTMWLVRDLDRVVPSRGLSAVDVRCAACGPRRGWYVETVKEQGDAWVTPLRLVLTGGALFYRGTGSFALSICGTCGLAEWEAKGAEKLRADEQLGVRRIDVVAALHASEGPYR
jgi:hypothetical protein